MVYITKLCSNRARTGRVTCHHIREMTCMSMLNDG
jgi:hypothetical protein